MSKTKDKRKFEARVLALWSEGRPMADIAAITGRSVENCVRARDAALRTPEPVTTPQQENENVQ